MGRLIPLIADASLSCGLKEDVTGDQLQFTAMAIFSRFRWLKDKPQVVIPLLHIQL